MMVCSVDKVVIAFREAGAQHTRRDQRDSRDPLPVEMVQQIGCRSLSAAKHIGNMQDQQVNERLLQHIGEAGFQSLKDISAKA